MSPSNLSAKDIEVLRLAVVEGPIRAFEIADVVDWAEQNSNGRSKVRYRFDKLEEKGLVESHYIEEDTTGSQHAPREIQATELGEDHWQQYNEDELRSDTLEGRVEDLEQKYQRIQENVVTARQLYFDLENRVNELEDALSGVNDVDEELERVHDQLQRIQRVFEQS